MSNKEVKKMPFDDELMNKIYQLYLITDPDNQSSTDSSELLIAKMNLSVDPSLDEFVEFDRLYQVGSLYRTVTKDTEKTKNVKIDGDEYSDLIRYNGKLLTCCDATGIVFWVDPKNADKNIEEDAILNGASSETIVARPQHIITHKDGSAMKLEWMTSYPSGVPGKDHLLMGGHGTTEKHKEVFILNALNNTIESYNWGPFYNKIAKHLNVQSTGYVVNEAIVYSEDHQCLVVAPRVISRSEPYSELVSYNNGCGKVLLLSCSNNKSFNVERTIVLEDYVDKDNNDSNSYHWGFSAIQSFGKKHFIGVQTQEKPADLVVEGESPMNSRLVMFDLNGKMYGAPVDMPDGPKVLFEFENRKIEGLWIDM